jgi:hypothetical protein
MQGVALPHPTIVIVTLRIRPSHVSRSIVPSTILQFSAGGFRFRLSRTCSFVSRRLGHDAVKLRVWH